MRSFVICALIVLVAGCSGSAAPVSGSLETRLLLILKSPAMKIAAPPFVLDGLVQLDLTLSGLRLHSVTALSTIGVEAQILKLNATIGALTLTDVFVFSRNVVEADQNYQIKFVRPDPGGIAGQYLPILYKDFVTPYAQLALLLGPTLTEPVLLRKKIAEAQVAVGGLTVTVLGLFANLGSALAPQWEIGTIVTVSGQTVSGVTVRSETYIGARRGFECVAECIPELQFSHGRVVSGFNVEYERFIVTGIKLLGLMVSVDTAANFNASEGPGGIESLQITSSGRVEPLALDLTDILSLNPDLALSSHTLITNWSMGDAFVTAIWTDLSGGIAFALREFITSFSLESFSVTSDLFTCASWPGCFGLAPIYQHDLQCSFKNNSWKLEALFVFLGFLKPLDKFVVMISYTEKGWSWRAGTAIQPHGLKVQELSVNFSF